MISDIRFFVYKSALFKSPVHTLMIFLMLRKGGRYRRKKLTKKIVTNQITRLSTYIDNRGIWLVTIFSDITVMTRSEKAGERLSLISPKVPNFAKCFWKKTFGNIGPRARFPVVQYKRSIHIQKCTKVWTVIVFYLGMQK